MALEWAWAFGAESALDLEAMGWDCSTTSTSAIEPSTAQQYTYTGSPTRYSLTMDASVIAAIPVSVSSPQGWRSVAVLHTSTPANNAWLIRAIGENGKHVAARMKSSGALYLYVDDVYKAATAIQDWSTWRFVSLRFDLSAGTWSGQIYVDGVAATAEWTDSGTASTTSKTECHGTSAGDRNHHLAQIIAWDDLADSLGPTPRYVTLARPGADISETGTWTPSTGATNHGVVGGVFDSSTYTEEATPTAADEVVVAPASDIATITGITPTSIDGVVVHTFSTGSGQQARAEVGDGTSTTTGTAGAIGASTTERHAAAPSKPSGGSWGASDTPEAVYHIVSV